MDVREKLVELQSIITCPNAICNFCEHFKNKSACERHKKEVIVDNMIAHGVTVQEWISVKDRLPDVGRDVLFVCENKSYGVGAYSDTYRDFFSGQFPVKGVTHWMPLPQPPKEE